MLKINKLLFLFTLFCAFCTVSFAQKEIVLVSDDATLRQGVPRSVLPKQARDSLRLAAIVDKLTTHYRAKGYLNFSIDSITSDSAHYYLHPFFGRNYQHTVLLLDSVTESCVHGTPSAAFLRNGTLPFSQYRQFASRLVSQMENKGYPFAQVSLLAGNLESDTAGIVHLERKMLVSYDSIILRGNLKLSRLFLKPYLSWYPKRYYNEQSVSQIVKKLSELPFLSIVREPGVEFVGDKAYLYLFLDRQRVNQFDGYVGLVPVNPTSGKVMVTGEVTLNLRNIFTVGEELSLKWQAPERYSQFLSLSADFPFLFGTPIGISGSFLLDKKDTTYLNMNYLVSIQYAFASLCRVHAYFDYRTSSVLLHEPALWLQSDSASFDYRKSMYGVRFAFQQLDDLLSPRRGCNAELDFAVGRRKILKNTLVDDSFYDEIDLKSTTYRIIARFSGFVPIGKRWGWVASARLAAMPFSHCVYNDLFRFGGTSTLQGFDELSLFASTYTVLLTEFRFWFAKQSFMHLFLNAAWYERRMQDSYFSDFPFGFGLGATFHTKVGNLYVSYALGQQKNSPISFKTGKIHLGLNLRF